MHKPKDNWYSNQMEKHGLHVCQQAQPCHVLDPKLSRENYPLLFLHSFTSLDITGTPSSEKEFELKSIQTIARCVQPRLSSEIYFFEGSHAWSVRRNHLHDLTLGVPAFSKNPCYLLEKFVRRQSKPSSIPHHRLFRHSNCSHKGRVFLQTDVRPNCPGPCPFSEGSVFYSKAFKK